MWATVWTDTRIEAELREFLADREDWPSYREFVAGGRARLREAITRRGGEQLWARRVGVGWRKRKPGYATRWTERRVRAELEEFLAGREMWPSYREFEEAGRANLRAAVARLGGAERWAKEIGLRRKDRRSGSRLVWNEREVERAVRPLVQRLGRWPTRSEFREAGLSSALTAMYRGAGIASWRERLGAPASAIPQRPVPERRIWSEEVIERELRAFCAGRACWPTWHEFVGAGKRRLYSAASLHGGIDLWRERLGLDPPRRTYHRCPVRRPRPRSTA
jgi:hypothetical protein